MQQVCPHHVDTLLDGGAHSVRYGVIIHDGSRQLIVLTLKKRKIPKLLLWEVTQQIFLNKAKDQARKKTEKNVEHCRLGGRTFNNLANVYDCDDEYDDI